MKIEGQKGVEDILFSKGLLTEDQLSAVKFEAINTGKSVETILRERGFVTSKQLTEARGELLNIPFVDVSSKTVSPKILELVSEATACKYHLLPFADTGGFLSVAMQDPLDLQVVGFLEKKTKRKLKTFIAEPKVLEKAIKEQYGRTIGSEVSAALEEVSEGRESIEEQLKDLGKTEDTIRDAPVSRIVGTLLEYAVKARASDLHIEPGEEKTRVRYRIDGVLQERLTLPKKVHDSVVSRVKILSDLKIDERRIPQDGRFKIGMGEQHIDLRVSTMPTSFGEKIVIRLLQEEGGLISIKDLGLRGFSLKRTELALLRPHGIILVTGPTGSGKTFTLAACLSKLNSVKVNIITLEDPVEILVPGINQVQVNPVAGLTFASGLRSILRQDPDIIMVGEIRDNETAELAIHAALTGHLVLSTLHTNSAAGALPRLIDMKVEPFLLASTVEVVVAQRLVRTICTECRDKYEIPESILADFKKALGPLFPKTKEASEKIYLYRGRGCETCGKTGYLGRTAIFEVLTMSSKISKLILEQRPTQEIEEVAIEEGMVTLKQDGFLKALEGTSSVEEILRVVEA